MNMNYNFHYYQYYLLLLFISYSFHPLIYVKSEPGDRPVTTTKPTTILTTKPTTIPTTKPTTIPTTKPTTMLIITPTTMLIITPTTMPIITPTTMITAYPTTKPTTIISLTCPKYGFNPEVSPENNCYENCLYNYYVDSSNECKCTLDDKCPMNYKLITYKKKCVLNCEEDSIYNCEYKNECLETCPTKEKLQKEMLNILKPFSDYKDTNSSKRKINEFLTLFKNGSLYHMVEFIFIKEEELTLKFDNLTYHLTSSRIQNINKPTKDNSIIKLKHCETILKEKYNISQNLSLLIFKVESHKKSILTSFVEYEVYHPITLETLNLSFCDNTPIEIHLFAEINETEINKHDPDSDLYNNICYSYSNNGSDLILDDRREEFFNNNLSLCEPKCKLIDYINETQEVICECDIKKQLSMITDIYISKGQFFNDLKKIDSYINLKVLKCYKYIFTKSAFLEINLGNYISLSLIFCFLISSIFFSLKGYQKLKLQIQKFLNKLEKPKKTETKSKSKSSNKNNLIHQNKNNSKNRFSKSYSKRGYTTNKNRFNRISNLRKSSERKKIESTQTRANKNHKINKNKNKIPINSKKKQNVKNKKNIIEVFTDSEMNSFSYEEALEKDKRIFTQYYFSLLRTKHPLIYTFYPIVDYNSIIIKISLFIISINLNYAINALFYNDLIIHKRYQKQGLFSFIYRLPQIIYSTIISAFINYIIKFLSSSENNVLKIKVKKIVNINIIKKELFQCLTIKFFFFYFFGIVFLSIFWFYLTNFCYIYKKTQYYVIKDVSISFVSSLINPFLLNILPGIFRIPSLRKKNRKCFYRFSKLLQML